MLPPHRAQRLLPSSHTHCLILFPPSFPPSMQLGALAEFRADWGAALRMYGEAYGYLPQV